MGAPGNSITEGTLTRTARSPNGSRTRPAARPELFDADESEVREGRTFPYATVGEWVLFSGVSDRAFRIYAILRAHTNRKRGDDKAWPTQPTIARMFNIKKTDGISAAIQELVAIGAVDINTVPTTKGRRNIYTVHEAPPDGYQGVISHREFYPAQDVTEQPS